MTTINGLPAHVLLVHAVVVLVPLSALLVVLVAVWPAARRRLAPLTTLLAAVALAAVPLTTEAGEWLERRVPESPLVKAHTELGDGMLPWAIGLFVVAVAITARQLIASRAERQSSEAESADPHDPLSAPARTSGPGGAVATVLVAVLAVVVSVGAVTEVYLIGDSGARAAWAGKIGPPHAPEKSQRRESGN